MDVLPVLRVHIREAAGSSPSAPTFSPFSCTSASMFNVPTRGGRHNYCFSYTVHVPTDVNRVPSNITSTPILVVQSQHSTPIIPHLMM